MKTVILVQKGNYPLVSPHLLARSGLHVHAIDGTRLDDRRIQAIIDSAPFAIALPLSLPGFISVRFAELIAQRRARIRFILISETEASPKALAELFDLRLRRSEDELVSALRQPLWTHAFERRSSSLDAAIQEVLKRAACLWRLRRVPESFASVDEYRQAVAESARHFDLMFVVSDPTDATRLRLTHELSAVQAELARRSVHSFSLTPVFSSRADELARHLLELRPHVVHFCGHGDSHGRLCFEDAAGKAWPADQAAIAAMFEPCRLYVECVMLNACFSAKQARLIGAHVDYAIGSTAEVSDAAAIGVSRAFYGALSVTGKIPQAFDAARTNMRLWHPHGVELKLARRPRARS